MASTVGRQKRCGLPSTVQTARVAAAWFTAAANVALVISVRAMRYAERVRVRCGVNDSNRVSSVRSPRRNSPSGTGMRSRDPSVTEGTLDTRLHRECDPVHAIAHLDPHLEGAGLARLQDDAGQSRVPGPVGGAIPPAPVEDQPFEGDLVPVRDRHFRGDRVVQDQGGVIGDEFEPELAEVATVARPEDGILVGATRSHAGDGQERGELEGLQPLSAMSAHEQFSRLQCDSTLRDHLSATQRGTPGANGAAPAECRDSVSGGHHFDFRCRARLRRGHLRRLQICLDLRLAARRGES